MPTKKEKDKSVGIYDMLLLTNIIANIAMEIYQQYKAGNPDPMTREEWDEVSQELVKMRKAAVANALSI